VKSSSQTGAATRRKVGTTSAIFVTQQASYGAGYTARNQSIKDDFFKVESPTPQS